MKISGLQNQNLHQLYRKQVDRSAEAGSVAGRQDIRQRTEGDSVELSANAQLMQKVLQEIHLGDDSSAERVKLLRQQVQNDSYEVSVQRLSERLLSEIM